jgi:alpha,alpha-trehalase
MDLQFGENLSLPFLPCLCGMQSRSFIRFILLNVSHNRIIMHLLYSFILSYAAALYINESTGVIAPCDSPLYCYGPVLQAIEFARPFLDSKTFVDLPTIRPLNEVLEAFSELPTPLINGTALRSFLSTNFGPPGGELAPLPADELYTNATFLDKIDDDIVYSFLSQVIRSGQVSEKSR